MKRGALIRIGGALILGAAAFVFAWQAGGWASLSSKPVDHGITSVFAFVSNKPAAAVSGDLTVLNVSPESRVGGRLSLELRAGSYVSSSESLPSGPPESSVQQGFTAVFGGALAASLLACDTSLDAATYSELTEYERNAVILNLREQEEDRVVNFGEPEVTMNSAAATEVAEAMTYKVVRFGNLQPAQWKMPANDETADPEEQTTETEVDVAGYEGHTQCAYDQTAMFTAQSWGKRWEFPAVTTLGATSSSDTGGQAQSTRRVYRLRETPNYSYSPSTGFTYLEGELEHNSSGLYGLRTIVDGWSAAGTSYAATSVPAGAIGFSSISYPRDRDLALFAAGAAVGLIASMLIAIGKTVARHRWPNPPTCKPEIEPD